MNYIGIDPGAQGALAVVDETGTLQALADTDGLRLHRKNDCLAIVRGNERVEVNGPVCAFIEAQHAFPKTPATTNFKVGVACGYWRGVFTALCIPFSEVSPAKWRKVVPQTLPRDKRDRKRLLVELAERQWPNGAFRTERGRLLDGRAEACWIAEACRRNMMAADTEGERVRAYERYGFTEIEE